METPDPARLLRLTEQGRPEERDEHLGPIEAKWPLSNELAPQNKHCRRIGHTNEQADYKDCDQQRWPFHKVEVREVPHPISSNELGGRICIE